MRIVVWTRPRWNGMPDEGMDADRLLLGLPALALKLRDAPDWRSGDGGKPPKAEGVYLLLEGGEPMYVGITTNLRQRLTYHGRLVENQGTYAYSLARQEAELLGLLTMGTDRLTRKATLANPQFLDVFREMSARVTAMSVHFVEVTDYVLMGMLELYVARKFRLKQPFHPH